MKHNSQIDTEVDDRAQLDEVVRQGQRVASEFGLRREELIDIAASRGLTPEEANEAEYVERALKTVRDAQAELLDDGEAQAAQALSHPD